ncbi:hypothetical protein [Actinomadura sp. 21ATH]
MTGWVQHYPAVPMTTPDGGTVDVDVQIAPLIEQYWKTAAT